MATFNEKCSSTFRKNVADRDVLRPDLLESLHFFDHTSFFLLEKSNLKILALRIFLPPKDTLVASFSETDAPTSR